MEGTISHIRFKPKKHSFTTKISYSEVQINKNTYLNPREHDIYSLSQAQRYCKKALDRVTLLIFPERFKISHNSVKFALCYSQNRLVNILMCLTLTIPWSHKCIYSLPVNKNNQINYKEKKKLFVSPYNKVEGFYHFNGNFNPTNGSLSLKLTYKVEKETKMIVMMYLCPVSTQNYLYNLPAMALGQIFYHAALLGGLVGLPLQNFEEPTHLGIVGLTRSGIFAAMSVDRSVPITILARQNEDNLVYNYGREAIYNPIFYSFGTQKNCSKVWKILRLRFSSMYTSLSVNNTGLSSSDVSKVKYNIHLYFRSNVRLPFEEWITNIKDLDTRNVLNNLVRSYLGIGKDKVPKLDQNLTIHFLQLLKEHLLPGNKWLATKGVNTLDENFDKYAISSGSNIHIRYETEPVRQSLLKRLFATTNPNYILLKSGEKIKCSDRFNALDRNFILDNSEDEEHLFSPPAKWKIIIHRDSQMMPAKKENWKTCNCFIKANVSYITYWCYSLRQTTDRTLFLSLVPNHYKIRLKSVIHKYSVTNPFISLYDAQNYCEKTLHI